MSAMLKAQGKYINNSGLDESYTELEICDPATFRQINNDKHMKRSFEANTTLYVALFCVYTKSFVSLHQITEKELREGIVNAAVVTENFTRKGKDVIRKNHHDLMARCVKSVYSRSYSFWYAFSLIRTEYSVRMWENVDQNNSEYRHFLCSDCPGGNKFLQRKAEVWRMHGKLISLLHQFYKNAWEAIVIWKINSVMFVARAFSRPESIHQVFLGTLLAKIYPILSSIFIVDVWPTKQRFWNLGPLFGWEFAS